MDITDLLTAISIDETYISAVASDPAFFASHVISRDGDMTLRHEGKVYVVAAASVSPDGEVMLRRFN